MCALLYFGFTFTRLSQKLKAKNILTSQTDLYNTYRAEIQSNNFSGETLNLCPIYEIIPSIKNFLKLGREIGKEFDTIIRWIEIFAGLGITENDIIFETSLLP